MRGLVRIDPLKVAIALGAAIAILGLAGAAEVRYEAAPAFDLDAELRIPAFVSGLILLLAAAAAYAASLWDRGRVPWLVLAALFAFMAADETLAVHETLEDVTAVDWQTLYLPVMAAAAAAWFTLLARLRRFGAPALLLLVGGVLWAVAGVLEAIQWTGPRERERAVAGYGILMGAEELLELCGSACFVLAPLTAARAWAGLPASSPTTGVHAGAHR